MLILTRKPGESLYIGDSIKITIVELKGHQIRVGIDAPKDMRIYREEIYLQILEENKKAAEPTMDAGLESLSAAWSGRLGGSSGDSDAKDGDGDGDGEKNAGLGAFSKLRIKESQRSPTNPSTPAQQPEVVVRRKRGRKSDE